MDRLSNEILIEVYVNACESGDSFEAYIAGVEIVRRGIDGSVEVA